MLGQMTPMTERLPTNITAVCPPLYRMNMPVSRQDITITERLPANITAVRLLTLVDELVFHKVAIILERHSTHITLKQSLNGMHTVMTGQITLSNESLPADTTPMWSLSRVRPPMKYEI